MTKEIVRDLVKSGRLHGAEMYQEFYKTDFSKNQDILKLGDIIEGGLNVD